MIKSGNFLFFPIRCVVKLISSLSEHILVPFFTLISHYPINYLLRTLIVSTSFHFFQVPLTAMLLCKWGCLKSITEYYLLPKGTTVINYCLLAAIELSRYVILFQHLIYAPDEWRSFFIIVQIYSIIPFQKIIHLIRSTPSYQPSLSQCEMCLSYCIVQLKDSVIVVLSSFCSDMGACIPKFIAQ